MSLLSLQFVLFVTVVLAVFQIAPSRLRPHVLLAASYLFYASHDPWYALLLLGVTLAVHRAALALDGHRDDHHRQIRLVAWLVAILVVVLAAFKVASVLPSGAGEGSGPALRILVPLGLSYYLFRLIGYLLDVYWEKLPAQRSVVRLALYASFFPQIVSGPIQRAGDFFAQLDRLDEPDPQVLSAGLRRILFGVVKKVAIADRLAVLVDAVHSRPGSFSSLELLLAAYLFAVQLYTDFSGVTDIAIGIGQLFGVKGPENFDQPFASRNLQEYWRRWHMSLTSWLADYLFTPLRMALRDLGQAGLALAVVINMVAIGVWHGAAWTYLAFGLFHGVLLAVSVLTLKRRDGFFRRRPLLSRLRTLSAPLGTFHLVVLGLIVFRARSLGDAATYLAGLANVRLEPGIVAPLRLDTRALQMTPGAMAATVALFGLTELVTRLSRQPGWVERFAGAPRPARWGIYYAMILVALVLGRFADQKFIYAQF